MATERTGTSPTADPKHLRAGEPVARRQATSSGDAPGVVRICAMVDGTLHDVRGAEAMAQLAGFLHQPEASVWIDLSGPSPGQVEQVGAALALHPLIVEDVLEGNQRAKLDITNGVVHLVLFHLIYDERVVASELDMVLGLGFLLTVHGGDWDPHESHHLGDGTEAILRDGETMVLGGIYVVDNGHSNTKVPFMADIPGLGVFFRNNEVKDERRELLVFVTPRIVQGVQSDVQ